MLDHVSLGVRDLAAAAAFYDAVLAPLGYVRLFGNQRGVGWGKPGDRDEGFAVLARGAETTALGPGCHVAISAPSREAVGAFHAEAVRMGGIDDGPPGLREAYGPGYYACFVRDLDGHRIEAVFHER